MAQEDLTGRRFGRLTVLQEDPLPYVSPTGRRTPKWICRCDCGNEVSVSHYRLLDGETKSCGCLRREAPHIKRTNLTGKRFGSLVVEKEGPGRQSSGRLSRYWICRCDCGNQISVSQRWLNSGKKTDCGCKKKEQIRSVAIDMTGQRFGKLTVVGLAEEKHTKYGALLWKCKCDCGKTLTATRTNLNSGRMTSCGCVALERSRQRVVDENVFEFFENTCISRIKSQKGPNKNNTSGVRGVFWATGRKRWIAFIGVKGKKIVLGRIQNFEDAVAARKATEEKYYAPIIERYEAEQVKRSQEETP